MAFLKYRVTHGYSPRDFLNWQYNVSRNTLLIVIIFTLLNCILGLCGLDIYVVFAAFIPYFIVVTSMVYCGKLPEEYYSQFFQQPYENLTFFGNGIFAFMLVISAICIVLYFLAWLLSKNQKVGWMIFALVFYSVDTLMTLFLMGISADMLAHYLFHGLVIYELSRGIHMHNKWVYMNNSSVPEDSIYVPDSDAGDQIPADSTPLRAMDRDVKSRILAEVELEGHKICYRRVKKVNELVIDDYVYDEYVAVMERAHTLSAQVGGLRISAGLQKNRSYITVNGNEIASMIRKY